MKIAVIGSGGLLGRELCGCLPGEVIPLTRADADITDRMTTAALLATHRPEVVVNCAAYNFVDQAENDPVPAFAVNAWAVRNLAKICRQLGAKLVHISTDYVFGLDRQRTFPLTENDPPGPLSVYGVSKLAGEYMVRTFAPSHLIVRACGLYGHRGSGGKGANFVDTMLRLAREGRALSVVNDQRCTPSYAPDVAAAIAVLIERKAEGIVHVTNSGETTWFELAQETFRLAGISAQLQPTTSALYAAPAHRPTYSVLSLRRLRSWGVPVPRPWQDALAAYLKSKSNC